MTVPMFGRVEDPEELDLGSFKAGLISYTTIGKTRKDTEHEFEFSPVQPFVEMLNLTTYIAVNRGRVSLERASAYILAALVSEEERERFVTLMESKTDYIEHTGIFGLHEYLREHYAERPTKRRTGSVSGTSPNGGRSRSRASARDGAT